MTPTILSIGTIWKRAATNFVEVFLIQPKNQDGLLLRESCLHVHVQSCMSLPCYGDTGRHTRGSGLLLDKPPWYETIPIQGFLTRQISLPRVVYSFTIEEQRKNSCSQGSGEAPKIRCKSRHSNTLASKESRAVNTSEGTQFLPEDYKLLIELKEEQNLPWSRIVEYFPRRLKGSLQVRYSTKIKDLGVKNRRQKP